MMESIHRHWQILFFLGERSQFANKMKALNRLKAKLLIVLENQRISKVEDIDRSAIVDLWCQETTRRYVFYPAKLVQDVKTGIQLPDLTSVLNGNIEPLIVAHINNRRSCNIITWSMSCTSFCLISPQILLIALIIIVQLKHLVLPARLSGCSVSFPFC